MMRNLGGPRDQGKNQLLTTERITIPDQRSHKVDMISFNFI